MSVFASGSLDKKVKVWDLLRVGFEIPKDLGGTDELLVSFVLFSLLIKDIEEQLMILVGILMNLYWEVWKKKRIPFNFSQL